jgi:LysM repeat protein
MDTISREPSGSPLALVGVIAGLLALVLSAVALVKASSTGKLVTEQETKLTRIDDIDARVAAVNKMATETANSHRALYNSAQTEMSKLFNSLTIVEEKVTKLETTPVRAAAPAQKAGAAPVTAGPGEYIVKAGDNFTRIAAAHGVTVADLEAANPGVSSTRLQIGQRLNVPGAR